MCPSHHPSEISAAEISFPQFVWLWNRAQRQATPKLHLEIAQWLGQRWEEGDRRLLLLCFRSAGKSTLIGMFSAWLLLSHPELRILVLSAEFDLAKKMVRNVKNIIERHPLTMDLIPDRQPQWAADQFTVRRHLTLRDPSILARGISSNITGSRADILICDDVEVPNTCRTPAKREDLREKLHETNFVLVPNGLQLYAGTPHSLQSIYAETPREGEDSVFLSGFDRLNIPLLDEYGLSRWPERFPKKKIDDLKRQTGPAKFQSQMMLEPIEDDSLRLDPTRLVRYDAEIDYRESNRQCVLSIAQKRMVSVTAWWDPAYGAPKRGDASVVAAVFVDEDGLYWLHDIRYLVHDPSRRDEVDEATQLCRQVTSFVQDLWIPSITIETNGLGRFLPAILQREINAAGLGCNVVEHTSKTSKDQRILDAFDPIIAASALHAHARIWQTPFINEMRDWRPGRNGRDDGIDAVSGCILAEPARVKRTAPKRTRGWRNRPVSQALEFDFIP